MCGTRGVRIPTPFQEQNEMTMTRNIYNRIAIILTAAMAAADENALLPTVQGCKVKTVCTEAYAYSIVWKT